MEIEKYKTAGREKGKITGVLIYYGPRIMPNEFSRMETIGLTFGSLYILYFIKHISVVPDASTVFINICLSYRQSSIAIYFKRHCQRPRLYPFRYAITFCRIGFATFYCFLCREALQSSVEPQRILPPANLIEVFCSVSLCFPKSKALFKFIYN